MKIAVIASQSPYLAELQRSAVLSEVEIITITNQSLQLQGLLGSEELDCVVILDQNLPESLDAYYSVLEQEHKANLLYALLSIDENKEKMKKWGTPYQMQAECTPMVFVDGLENGTIHAGPKTRQEHQKEEKEELGQLERKDGLLQEQVNMMNLSGSIQNHSTSYQTPNVQNQTTVNTQQNQRLDYTQQNQTHFNQPNLQGTYNTQPQPMQQGVNNMYNPGYQNPNNQATAIQFKPITVCINSPKGGVGKTTLAIELSSLIALRAGELDMNEMGHLSYNKRIRVCLVDLNPSFDTMAATLSSIYSRANFTTVSDWFRAIDQKIVDTLDEKTRREVIQNGYQGVSSYLDTGKIHFTKEEIEQLLVIDPETGLAILPSIALPLDASLTRPEYLRVILNTLKEYFDVVLVDTGNNISFFTLEAMRASDEVLLVCSKSKGAAATVQKLTKTLADMKNPVDPSKLNLVLNNPNGSDSVFTSQSFASVLKMNLVAEIPYDERVRMAHEDGHVFSIYNKKSDFAKACIKLAQSICPLWIVVPNRNDGGRAKKKKKRGFFGRFRG